MNNVFNEAINITKELGNIAFIGALAVISHTNNDRKTHDLDLVMATEISEDDLIKKEYKIVPEHRKKVIYSPRNFKVDIYNKKEVNDIPIKTILDTSIMYSFDKRKKQSIRVASLEVMIVAKYRAQRDQDGDDLRNLIRYNINNIDWESIKKLTTQLEFEDFKNVEKFVLNNFKNKQKNFL